jgi:hypothetical protein
MIKIKWLDRGIADVCAEFADELPGAQASQKFKHPLVATPGLAYFGARLLFKLIRKSYF